MKHNGGIVGLTENRQALKRYLVCSSLVGELCRSFEEENINTSEKHHSESAYLQKKVSIRCDPIIEYNPPIWKPIFKSIA